jgi:hypothetical protein
MPSRYQGPAIDVFLCVACFSPARAKTLSGLEVLIERDMSAEVLARVAGYQEAIHALGGRGDE